MAKLDNDDYGGIAEALMKAQQNSSYVRPGSASTANLGGAEAMTNSSSKITQAANGIYKGLGDMAGGTFNAKTALDGVTGAVGMFGGAASSAAKVVNDLGTGVFNVNRTLNETGKYGVNFGQNLGEANLAIKQAQLTLPEFATLIQQNGKAMAGMAGGQNASAKAFLGLLADIQADPVAQDFKALGVSQSEFASALAMTTRTSITGANNTKEAHDRAIASTLKYVGELNALADLSGKSREEQERLAAEVQSRADVEAKTIEKMKEGDLDYGKRMLEGQSAFGNSKETQEMFAEMMINNGSAMSESALDTQAALGSASNAVGNYAKVLNDPKATEAQKLQAKEQAQAAVDARIASKDFTSAVAVTNGGLYNMGKLQKDYYEVEKNIIQKQAELKAKGDDYSELAARKALMVEGKLDAAGKIIDKDGLVKANEGAIVGRTINQIDNLGKVVGGQVAVEFNKLNREVGTTVNTAIPNLNNALKNLSTPTGLGRGINQGLESGAKAIGVTPAANVPGTNKEMNKRLNGSPGIPDFLNGGDFNKMFENFGSGTPIEVHGEEMIARKDQMGQIMGKMQAQMGNSIPDLNKMAQQVQNQVGPELNNMLNNVKTKVSAAATADSTGQATPKPQTTPSPVPISTGSATMTDLREQLIQLNKGMMQLISHTAEQVNVSEKQVRAIQSNSNDMFE